MCHQWREHEQRLDHPQSRNASKLVRRFAERARSPKRACIERRMNDKEGAQRSDPRQCKETMQSGA
jgi:hypothetical protein